MNIKILSIAGSDSIGGAGIQADIKAITYFGGHAVTAITAVTAQDLESVYSIHYLPINIIIKQIEVVLKNGVAAIKIGMLGNLNIANAVLEVLRMHPSIKIILDPVFIATSGAKLLTDDALEIISKFFPISYLITPNIPEAETLLNTKIISIENMIDAGVKLSKSGNCSVLVKGGHFPSVKIIDDTINEKEYSEQIIDVLVTKDGEVHFFKNTKINNVNSHGTGCALSSSIATLVATGLSLKDAITESINYVRNKIQQDAKTF